MVGIFVQRHTPRWGKIGQYLSMLDIDEEYLRKERPFNYDKEGMLFTAMLLDGKYLTNTLQTDKMHAHTHQSTKSGGCCQKDVLLDTNGALLSLHPSCRG